tara:strand:+ start:265 stop:957 length:693 start_codon:yes stop_codon:yes gene_type:complete
MVVIECPHCEEHIELDDDASGLFECPFCEGEFEWGESDTLARTSTGDPNNSITTFSHIAHGLGGVLLIFGLFSNWIVLLSGEISVGITPFGVKGSFYGVSNTVSWFEGLSTEDAFLAFVGLIFMLLVIIALLFQIAHITFRIIVHMTESGNLEISIKMIERAYYKRWATSKGALICTVGGYLLIQLTAFITLGADTGFEIIPRPSFYMISLIVVMIAQVYFSYQETLINQ